jgi:hypothetical protein
MFGGARKRATQHAIEAVRPLVATYQANYGLPAGFWRSEFVLGFIGFMISFHATQTSGRKLSQLDKGCVLSDTLTALSNMNGHELMLEFNRLARQEPKSVEFELGADYAAICSFYLLGKTLKDGPNWIEKAREMAETLGHTVDHAAILQCLFTLLFIEPIHERFSGTADS